jgi:branched-chain amino acid transport system substrate-binding protein
LKDRPGLSFGPWLAGVLPRRARTGGAQGQGQGQALIARTPPSIDQMTKNDMKAISKSGFGAALFLLLACFLSPSPTLRAATPDGVRIGLNAPLTGPYRVQGLHQKRAAELAVEEINAAGGIQGRPIRLIQRDSQSRVDVTTSNVSELIDREQVAMVFGGSSSAVAIAAGKVCRAKGVPFFGTLTYSNETTGTEASRYVFRECYNAWMGAKALSSYLRTNFPSDKNRYFFVTADYTWGHTTEESIRKFSGTEDQTVHQGVRTPFPGAKYSDFWDAIQAAQEFKPDVLVLVLFGNDMAQALKLATALNMKSTVQIVVPNVTLGMADSAGAKAMEGVIGATPWEWQVPYRYDYPQGKAFVEKYVAKYGTYPSTSAASAYTILYEYKSAVDRAGGFAAPAVIRALEGHEYALLKDRQRWRDFDHQSVQTVYAVRGKPQEQVRSDRLKLDYFEIIGRLAGEQAAQTRQEWNAVRRAAGKPIELEGLR